MANTSSKKTKVIFFVALACIVVLLIILLILHTINSNRLDNLVGNVAKDEEVQSLKAITDETGEKVKELTNITSQVEDLKNDVEEVEVKLTATQKAATDTIQADIVSLVEKYEELNNKVEEVVAKEETLKTKAEEETVIALAEALYEELEYARVTLQEKINEANLDINLNTNNTVEIAKNEINTNTNQTVDAAKNDINSNINELSENIAIGYNDFINMYGYDKNLAAAKYNDLWDVSVDIQAKVTNIGEDTDTLIANTTSYFNTLTNQVDEFKSDLFTKINNNTTTLNNIQAAITAQDTVIANGFETVNSNISTLSSNVDTYNTQINNNVTSIKTAIEEATKNITGTTTLTYISNQAQNTMALAKQSVDLLGTATDDKNTSTVFGKLAMVSTQISSLDTKVENIDEKVDEVLEKLEPSAVITSYQRGLLVNDIKSILNNGSTYTEYTIVYHVMQWLENQFGMVVETTNN